MLLTPLRRALPLLLLAPLAFPGHADAITGGVNSTDGSLAFVAEVRDDGGLCTGSLIRPDWVLTAHHCARPASVGEMTVRVGNTTSNTGGELRRVIRIIAHPASNGGHNDIALLQLSSPITNIAPVPLAPPASAARWDGVETGVFGQYDQGVATGWGEINGTGALATTLQRTFTEITPPTPDGLGIMTLRVTGGPCPGDSGGPLLVNIGGTLMQVGVTKSAPKPCMRGASSYSEVGAGSNRTWLDSVLAPMPYAPFGATDWDNDGHQDIIARENATGTLWLYPGVSARGFSPVPRSRIGWGWNGYTPFGLTDYDRDGRKDIIVREDSTGTLWLYPGEATRTPSATPRTPIAGGMRGYTPFGAADYDRDGNPDVIVRDDSNGVLYLYPGLGSRGPGTPRVRIGSGWNPYTPFGLADYDRDGNIDIVARDNDSANLYLYPGEGRRAQSNTPRAVIGWGWTGFTPFGLSDWDRDGSTDIVVRSDTAAGPLWLYPGQGRRGASTIAPVWAGGGW